MHLRCLILLLCTCGLAQMDVQANGITITNLQKTGNDLNNNTFFNFTVSWENSWRLNVGPSNYDAAYVFAKFRENGGPWQPMFFTGILNPGGGAVLERAPSPSLGFFVYRDANGAGSFSTNLQVQWLFENAGVDGASDVEVRFFAVEMVNVPEGTYDLGDGDIANGGFYRGEGEFPAPPYAPWRVNSEAQINIGIFALTYDGFTGGDQVGSLGTDYPKGHGEFFCMKYEVSQQQWVDFFNTLTDAQKTNLDITGPAGKNTDTEVNRNGVAWDETNDATTTLPDLPVNYITNAGYLAYLDWAGLRPMTELEYEKASRGGQTPVTDGYAWGNTNLHAILYSLSAAGTPGSTVSNPGTGTGNAAYDNTTNEMQRVGIFAASVSSPTRQETGGSYYGIMELSGNLYERCISVGDPANRAFTGVAGNHTLAATGTANVPDWPTNGLCFRGGSYLSFMGELEISDRRYGNYTGTVNLLANGIRGVSSTR